MWRASRKSHTVTPLPPLLVDSLLVSKPFFVSAARAFVANQTFDDANTGSDLIFTSSGSIIFSFVTAMVMDAYKVIALIQLPPHLKLLTLIIDDAAVSRIITDKLVWEDDLSNEDFEAIAEEFEYHCLAGLREFRIEPGEWLFAEAEEEKAKWHENVQKLETFLMPIVTRAKDDSGEYLKSNKVNGRTPLYHGSKVYFETEQSAEMTTHGRPPKRSRSSSSEGFLDADALKHLRGIRKERRIQKQQAGKLTLQDVPDTLSGFMELVVEDGDRVFEMVMELKEKEKAGLL